jgi:hypothetical protein
MATVYMGRPYLILEVLPSSDSLQVSALALMKVKLSQI